MAKAFNRYSLRNMHFDKARRLAHLSAFQYGPIPQTVEELPHVSGRCRILAHSNVDDVYTQFGATRIRSREAPISVFFRLTSARALLFCARSVLGVPSKLIEARRRRIEPVRIRPLAPGRRRELKRIAATLNLRVPVVNGVANFHGSLPPLKPSAKIGDAFRFYAVNLTTRKEILIGCRDCKTCLLNQDFRASDREHSEFREGRDLPKESAGRQTRWALEEPDRRGGGILGDKERGEGTR